jgi:tetratricopeptide (TPR) repeat protein
MLSKSSDVSAGGDGVSRRVVVDQNGLVVSVGYGLDRTAPPVSKRNTGGKTGANKRRKSTPKFNWVSKATTEFSASATGRRRVEEQRRQAKEKAARIRVTEEALRRTEEKFAALKQLTDFDKIYALGVAASKASPPNYSLAIAAFKKAYRLDPRRKVRSGRKPDPGLFEVPTRLAATYRMNGQVYESKKMYEWVLKHHDSRMVRMELAAAHEDTGKHLKALKLYEESVLSDPHDVRALRGEARTLEELGRGEEAHEAYKRDTRKSPWSTRQ